MGDKTMVRAVVASALAVLLTACTSGEARDAEPTTSDSTTSTTGQPSAAASGSAYVALGDSFTAGPGLAQPQQDAGYCQRSKLNWPSLLAKTLKVDSFTDLSCSGATTADQAATADSTTKLGTATKLVTIGIGGNDGGLFASLISACSNNNGGCTPFVRDQAPAILKSSVPAIASFVDDVRAKAPDAEIVLVGYLRILPDSGTCPAVGIPAAETAAVVDAEKLLDSSLAEAAGQADIEYVSLRAMSSGHDACAGDQAWTNGAAPADGDGIFFHPRRAGMAAVADVVAERLQS